uniref:Uncharacterized protein n=1 Tax=Rhizophora mucronata TaxID=61149 RepID=A0A2P2QBL0_RHIMU
MRTLVILNQICRLCYRNFRCLDP